MNDTDKVLTYEEAKQLCIEAFDCGVLYGSESMRYGVNATAYDLEHWLKKNEGIRDYINATQKDLTDTLRKLVDVCNAEELHVLNKALERFVERLRLAEADE